MPLRVRWLTRSAIVWLLLFPAPAHAQLTGASAAGQPYVDCVTAPARIARMEAGMPGQHEALRRAEVMLRQAEVGNAEATQQSEEAILDAAKDWAQDQLTLVRKVQMLKDIGLDRQQRRRLLELVKQAEDGLEEAQEAFEDPNPNLKRTDALQAFTESNRDLQALATFLEESGLAGDLENAAVAAKLTPLGQAIVGGFTLARDMLYLGAQQRFSDEELARARENFERLRWSVSYNQERLDNLKAFAEPCFKPKPNPPADPPAPVSTAAAPTSAPPPPPAAEAPKKGGPSKLGLSLALGLGAIGAGGYAISKAVTAADTGGGDAGSGSGSGTPTIKSFSTWVCEGNGCRGTLTIHFPVRSQTGHYIVGTDSIFLGSASVSTSAPAGDVTFQMTKTPYLTCYQTQTTVAIWDGQTTNVPARWQLKTSIPVSCR